MKIHIIQNAANLDPGDTCTNAEASLSAYVAELTSAILKEYPEAQIIHENMDGTCSFHIRGCDDASYDEAIFRVQEIAEQVYGTGNFWI